MQIITDRLILRDFIENDWPAVLAYQRDPHYLRFYAWTERTPEAVQAFVQRFVAHQAQQPRTRFQLAITLHGELIGNCGVRMDQPGAVEAEIGYELDPRFWGQDYATEAARAMLDFAFKQLHLHRVSSWCVAENTGSAHVLEKLGMQMEGRLREKEFYKGKWWDHLLYGILEHEYLSSQ